MSYLTQNEIAGNPAMVNRIAQAVTQEGNIPAGMTADNWTVTYRRVWGAAPAAKHWGRRTGPTGPTQLHFWTSMGPADLEVTIFAYRPRDPRLWCGDPDPAHADAALRSGPG